MPYPGVPGKYTGKIDRCVKEALRKDDTLDRSSAIAICIDSIVPNKELDMPKYREEKRKKEARQNEDAKNFADDPLADSVLDEGIVDALKSVRGEMELEEKETQEDEIKEEEEKGMLVEAVYRPYGGAISFDELDAYLDTQEEIDHIESTTYMFKSVVSNILVDERVGYDKKADMIGAAAEVYKMKLSSREKGFGEKVKEFVQDMFKKEDEVEQTGNLEIITTKDGQQRWYGVFTNNYLDKEKEILTSEAHKEFVAFLKENPQEMPEFWSWHIPGTTRKNKADYVEYIDGFMIASGPLMAEEAKQLEKAIQYDDGRTGMSHGMYVLGRDPENKQLITKYRSYEISDLPLDVAANGFTNVNSTKEVYMTDEKFERLAATIGEDAAKKVVANIDDNKEVLEELGIENKEAEESEQKETPETESAEKEEETSLDTESVVKQIIEQIGLKDLSDLLETQQKEISDLRGQVKSLQKDEDEKIADLVNDKSVGSLIWQKDRPSQSEETEVDEDEEKEIKASGPGWVSQVLNSEN